MRRTDLPIVMRLLKNAFLSRRAPIVDLIQAQTRDPFKVLVATILSARTLDQTTAAVCRKLFRVVQGPADLTRLPAARLERLLYPVGFTAPRRAN